jgi:hypothetical protein
MTGHDPEILDMLQRLQGTEQELDARGALQRFRAEALAGVRDGADREGKEELVRRARERLRDSLRRLLS